MMQIQEMHSRNGTTEREEDAWNPARDSKDVLILRIIVNEGVSWLSFLNVSQSWDEHLLIGAGAYSKTCIFRDRVAEASLMTQLAKHVQIIAQMHFLEARLQLSKLPSTEFTPPNIST